MGLRKRQSRGAEALAAWRREGARRGVRAVLLAAIGLMLLSPPAGAEVRLSTGFDVSSGDYGLDRETRVGIVFAEAAASAGPWNAQVNVPTILIDGPANGGIPNLESRRAFLQSSGRDQTSGLGDIRIGLSRFVLLPGDRSLLDLSASLKLPTADADRLLGTGETDLTLRTDYLTDFAGFTFVIGAGYTFAGRSERFDVQDRSEFSVTAVKDLSLLPDLGVTYSQREAVISGIDDVKELSVSASFVAGRRWSIIAYGLTGLSETSADLGLGMRLTFRPSD